MKVTVTMTSHVAIDLRDFEPFEDASDEEILAAIEQHCLDQGSGFSMSFNHVKRADVLAFLRQVKG